MRVQEKRLPRRPACAAGAEAPQRDWAGDTAVIGHHESRSEGPIRALVDTGVPITALGIGLWPEADVGEFSKAMIGRMTSDEDYARAIEGVKSR